MKGYFFMKRQVLSKGKKRIMIIRSLSLKERNKRESFSKIKKQNKRINKTYPISYTFVNIDSSNRYRKSYYG